MVDLKSSLWPYSTRAAILAIPIVWIFFIIIFFILQNYTNSLDAETRRLITIVATIVSLVPLGMVLFEFVSSRGGVIDLKGFKIDFRGINSGQPDAQRVPILIPDNIGITGAIIADSTPMKIISALKEATGNEVVIIDIKDGRAWWATRLLALSAGAVRAGSPKAFVFLGKKENKDGTFLGWGMPVEIQNAILDAKDEYRSVFQSSMRIAKQVAMFVQSYPPLPLPSDVANYTNNIEYINLGDAAFEQILMDKLRFDLETIPDRLNSFRIAQLFEPCLYRDVIDLSWPNEKQISKLLEFRAPYIAILHNGKYVNMLRRDEGDRLIIRGLFSQSQQGK